MSLLSNHLLIYEKPTNDQIYGYTFYVAGTYPSLSLRLTLNFIQKVDCRFRSFNEICSRVDHFISLIHMQDTCIVLPNTMKIVVALSGDVKLSSNVIFKNVLFVS